MIHQQLLIKMTGNPAPGPNFLEHGCSGGTVAHRLGAARVKRTARRWVEERRRNTGNALKDALAFQRGQAGNQQLRVGVQAALQRYR